MSFLTSVALLVRRDQSTPGSLVITKGRIIRFIIMGKLLCLLLLAFLVD